MLGSGLVSWIFSGGTDDNNEDDDGSESDVRSQVLSATERDKMFRDLRYDPNNIRSEFDYPSEYVSMVLDFSMQSFDLSLVSGVEQVTRVGTSRTTTSALPLFSSVGDQVLSVRLDVVAVTLSQKSMSQKISFSMRTMNIYDPMCHPKRMD